MRRRQFVAGLGSVAAWPAVARAQQPAVPAIGFLSGYSAGPSAQIVAAFRQGLGEAGYVEGRNVALEFRWAEFDYGRLPGLAADLVRRNVAVIFAGGAANATFAAKAATSTIPIVFVLGSDPVELGLVASLNRPGGNLTGMMAQGTETNPKRLGILRQLVPGVTTFGLLVNPNNRNTVASVRNLQAMAKTGRFILLVVPVTSESEFETAFETLARQHVVAFLHANDALFTTQYEKLIELAARYRMPTIYIGRQSTDAGGLMNYGANVADTVRQGAHYVGRILRGEKAANLPIQQPTKFEFVINLKTAKALDLTIPETLLATADEVIQ